MPKIKNEIWSRIREGDSVAFAELYDGFASAMFSLSLQILNDRWEAEEVIQDVFSYLWRKPDAFSPEKGKFSSWLLVLTRNRSIDRYRSRKRRTDKAENDEILGSRSDPSQKDASDEATDNDERAHLREAFSELPDEQRRVLELSYFKGMNHLEIAERLDLSLGTVKSRIRLGVEKLRYALSSLRI